MSILEFLDFIAQFEAKIRKRNFLVIDCFQEQRLALVERCKQDKVMIQTNLVKIDRVEESPRFCLTVALGSYLLHLNPIFYLDLPMDLQDWLFYGSVHWIKGNAIQRNKIEQNLLQRESDWVDWVNIPPKDWSPRQQQILRDSLGEAFQHLQEAA